MLNRVRAVTLALGSLTGCASAPVPSAARPAACALSPLAPLAPPSAAFAPPAADASRKARLLALAPKLDELHRARLAETRATGAAVAIILEGEVVYLRGFGVRDVATGTPVDADTVFRIGSVSKTITALAVLRLRDQGRLVLDAPAATYLPALSQLHPATSDSPPITVRHLLSMTSGLGYDDQWGAVTFGKSEAELADFLARGVSFGEAAGERYRYSNLGFALLGEIVANVSGKSFEEYVASDVFAPLGLTSSGYVTGKLPRERLATGYYRDGERLIPETIESDGVFAPAGGAYTTIRDLARYAAFHLAAYPPRNDEETGPVRRSTLREMHTVQSSGRYAEDAPILKRGPDGSPALATVNYGLGWAQQTSCFVEGMIQHGGYEPGYFAVVRLLPRQRIGIVTLSTSERLVQGSTLGRTLELLRDGGVLDPPNETPAAPLVTARARVLGLLARWDPELAARSFDAQSLRYSFLRQLPSDFERMNREHGACRADGDVIPFGRAQGRFRLACERGNIEFLAYLTPDASPLLQSVEYRQELPVGAEAQAALPSIVAALNGAALSRPVLADSADAIAIEHRLARLHGAHGACELEAALFSDAKGKSTFRLRCAQAPLELTLQLDPKTSRITDVTGAAPRTFGAICAE